MANFSLKLLVSILHIRSLSTQASITPKTTLKLAAVAKSNSKNKIAAFTSDEKDNSVVAFLKSRQFSDTQISLLAMSHPSIFRYKVASNLEPKFEFFEENGFKSTHLAAFIMKNPLVLRRSLNAHLVPLLEYLKTQLGEINEMTLVLVLTRASKSLQPNIDLLLKEGVPMDSILKLVTYQPRCLLCGGDKIASGIEVVKKFGIEPTQRMFIHVLRLVLSRSESSLKSKMEFMKSLGWSDEDIVSTIAHQPSCLMCSEDKLQSTMEYYVKTMKVEPKTVVAYPKMVMYSLEKRIIPRCKVLLALREEKVFKERSLPSSINMSEKDFVKYYIVKYLKQLPHLMDLYRGLKMDSIAIQQ